MPEIKGWCPGALAPMASGDGLLIRPKIVGSQLTLACAKEIAALSEACGNGRIDLSQRAQLQLRGLSAATLCEAQARLAAIDLLAPDAETEAVLNIVSSPLPKGAFDADVMAKSLAAAIAKDAALRALPGKFLFLVDHGGAPGLADVGADIRLEAHGQRIAVVIDGARQCAAICERSAAIDAALALARAFVSSRAERPLALRRMRALVGEIGADAVFCAAEVGYAPYRSLCARASREVFLGARSVGGAPFFAGLAAPHGRLQAQNFAKFVLAAERAGATELRLTPWRSLLAPVASLEAAQAIVSEGEGAGLIGDTHDARLGVVACPGAPECPQALGPTREGLEALADCVRSFAREGIGLHVSGCAKGCAKPSPTPITLVATGKGFDLIYEGRASDAPLKTSLTLEDVARLFTPSRTTESSCPAP
jgi:precorrin-3B synthase